MLYHVMPYTPYDGPALVYILPGKPIPLQRHRTANGHAYDPQKKEKLYTGLQLRQIHGDRPLHTGPLQLTVTFYFKPPQNNKKLLNTYHFSKPDTDNCIKYICDASQDILFHNDSQIAQIIATKLYSQDERTEFIIVPLK
jgi:Holliday junction resolvase RusA-like endonuclease